MLPAARDEALCGSRSTRRRRATTTADVPVGAVVVDASGAVIGTGRNERELRHDPTAHAEVVALREAAARLRIVAARRTRARRHARAVRHVRGRDPREPRRSRVSCSAPGTRRPAPPAACYDVLRERRLPHRVEVVAGVLADEAEAQLRAFFAPRRSSSTG